MSAIAPLSRLDDPSSAAKVAEPTAIAMSDGGSLEIALLQPER